MVTKLESLMRNLSESVDIKIKHLSDTVDGKNETETKYSLSGS